MKNRDGWIEEEYITASFHHFEDGKYAYSESDGVGGCYTGRFRFVYYDGGVTKWYRAHNAPKWLMERYLFIQNKFS